MPFIPPAVGCTGGLSSVGQTQLRNRMIRGNGRPQHFSHHWKKSECQQNQLKEAIGGLITCITTLGDTGPNGVTGATLNLELQELRKCLIDLEIHTLAENGFTLCDDECHGHTGGGYSSAAVCSVASSSGRCAPSYSSSCCKCRCACASLCHLCYCCSSCCGCCGKIIISAKNEGATGYTGLTGGYTLYPGPCLPSGVANPNHLNFVSKNKELEITLEKGSVDVVFGLDLGQVDFHDINPGKTLPCGHTAYQVLEHNQELMMNFVGSSGSIAIGQQETAMAIQAYDVGQTMAETLFLQTCHGDSPSDRGALAVYTDKIEGDTLEGLIIYPEQMALRFGKTDNGSWGGTMGENSVAIGYNTFAQNNNSFAGGYDTQALGDNSFAGGNETYTYSPQSVSFGNLTKAGTNVNIGKNAFAIGQGTSAENTNSFAGGFFAKASGRSSFAFGANTKAFAKYSFAIGDSTQALGDNSFACGELTQASGENSVACGTSTKTIGKSSFAGGFSSSVSGDNSFVYGQNLTIPVGNFNSMLIGQNGTALGLTPTSGIGATGITGIDLGSTFAGEFTSPYGIYGKGSFQIAGGDGITGTNAITVILGTSTFTNDTTLPGVGGGIADFWSTSGADYAEYFEWEDGNPAREDRIGRFVELTTDKIRLASASSTHIVGIVSSSAGVIGDAAELRWQGAGARDDFGRLITRMSYASGVRDVLQRFKSEGATGVATILAGPDDHTLVLGLLALDSLSDETKTALGRVVPLRCSTGNSDYDASRTYVPRSARPEWSPIGLLGKLYVRDDGTCVPGQLCYSGTDGVATATAGVDGAPGYRVMSRRAPNVVRVFVK